MAEIIVTTRSGEEHKLELREGLTLMELIREAGIDELMALCGGCCSCATCHVHIDKSFSNKLLEMSSDEDDLLDSSDHRDSTSRLSCQIPLDANLDEMAVRIAEED